MIDYDKIANAPSKAVANAAYGLVNQLQRHPKETQSVAVAALFLTVCRVHRLKPNDVFTVANNMLADTIHGERPEFRALRLYAEHELK